MIDDQYERACADILENGHVKADRTGTGTISTFGLRLRYDLSKGFPLITTKRTPLRLIATELVWFLRGSTNVQWLKDSDCHIWDEWADKDGELGPIYGKQWRKWQGELLLDKHGQIEGYDHFDQIAKLIETLKINPDSRRMVVSAWNVAQLEDMALEPCHVMFQCYVVEGRLSLQVYQRSCDMFLGVPFNIASYALLTHMLAQVTGLTVGDLIWVGGDCHIYTNHVQQTHLMLSREVLPFSKLVIAHDHDYEDIDLFEPEDFTVPDYQCHPAIKADVAV